MTSTSSGQDPAPVDPPALDPNHLPPETLYELHRARTVREVQAEVVSWARKWLGIGALAVSLLVALGLKTHLARLVEKEVEAKVGSVLDNHLTRRLSRIEEASDGLTARAESADLVYRIKTYDDFNALKDLYALGQADGLVGDQARVAFDRMNEAERPFQVSRGGAPFGIDKIFQYEFEETDYGGLVTSGKQQFLMELARDHHTATWCQRAAVAARALQDPPTIGIAAAATEILETRARLRHGISESRFRVALRAEEYSRWRETARLQMCTPADQESVSR